MNHSQVMQSASKAVLRASNALDDLHNYLKQLKGHDAPQGLQATSLKASHARDLIREIDAALTDPDLVPATSGLDQLRKPGSMPQTPSPGSLATDPRA
jgi:hypothetical protein